jgi:hypothetical protein
LSTEIASFILQCWHEQNSNRLKVVRVDTGGEVALSRSIFLLRLFVDDTTSIERCLIRHLMSGREVYIQSGTSLQAFIKSCLLNDDTPPPESIVGET